MLRLVYALAVGTWLGAAVCLSFIVTPTAHGTFAPEQARRLLRPLFPRCSVLGIVCGFAALGTIVLGKASLPHDMALRLALPPAVALVCALAGSALLVPLSRLAADDPRFARLHRAAAMLNTTTIGALVLAMAAAVMR
jgi:hypothetical protein